MSDDPDYDPNLDWVPPAKSHGDDILVKMSVPTVSAPTCLFGRFLLWAHREGPDGDAPERQRRRRERPASGEAATTSGCRRGADTVRGV